MFKYPLFWTYAQGHSGVHEIGTSSTIKYKYLVAKKPHNVELLWVKGHAGNPGNERCDILATAAADGSGKIVDEGLVEE